MLTSLLRRASTAALLLILGAMILPGCVYAADSLFKGDEAVPSDAIVLFGGKDLSKWVKSGSADTAAWRIEKGYMTAGGGDIETKQHFTDCQLHVEFWVPLLADRQGQGRGNSGIFIQGWVYELQVLDSYGLKSGPNDCGAIYNIYAPLVNACRPPETWQTYDVFFHSPKFDADGKKTANARISVLQNGVWIHDNADVPYATPSKDVPEPKDPGPVRLQDHGCDVRFRNIWIRPLGPTVTPEAK